MEDVLRKRVVGAGVLIVIGIALPVLLSRCVQDPVAENQAMRVYEITPSGDVKSIDTPTEVASISDDNERAASTPNARPTSAPDNTPIILPPDNDAAETADAAGPATHAQSQRDAVNSTPEEKQPAAPASPPADTGLEETVAAGSWVVQVASFSKESNARAMTKQLDKSYTVFYTAAEVDGNTWYRVRVGPFDSDATANNMAAELRAQGRNTLVVHVD